ncbi:MAG: hypothetical protein ABSE72_10725 [Bacteroidales bacterium]|jgi:hypothetical protein
MKKLVLLAMFLAACSAASAQKTLVLEKIGTPTRYGFHLGDDVKIRTKKQNLIIKSYLWNLTDSSVTIGSHTTIQLSDISAVYRNIYFPHLMTRILLYAGAGYFILDSFNNLINHERVFIPQTMIISGSLIGVSLAIIPLSQKKCKIGIRWKLKIMDINLN